MRPRNCSRPTGFPARSESVSRRTLSDVSAVTPAARHTAGSIDVSATSGAGVSEMVPSVAPSRAAANFMIPPIGAGRPATVSQQQRVPASRSDGRRLAAASARIDVAPAQDLERPVLEWIASRMSETMILQGRDLVDLKLLDLR